jgi:hypothetical protein
VTDGEPQTNPEQKPARVGANSHFKRVLEWFWRGATLAKRKQALPHFGERATELVHRAHVSADIARIALMPAEPLEASAEPIASELYRQSAYWSACALSFGHAAKVSNGALPEVWSTLDDSFLQQGTTDAERLEHLRGCLRDGSFVYFADLPEVELRATCLELRKLAEVLLAKLDERTRVVKAVRWQRVWRLSLILVLLLSVAEGSMLLREARQEHSDFAHGKPWRASSTFEQERGCESPEQTCSENTGYFMHTREERNPWVEWDLGRPQRISLVRVENRHDCCFDRAVPMVVEISTDHRKWRQVARRNDEFSSSWEASFDTVPARWVRLRVLKKSFLHLARVSIFP